MCRVRLLKAIKEMSMKCHLCLTTSNSFLQCLSCRSLQFLWCRANCLARTVVSWANLCLNNSLSLCSLKRSNKLTKVRVLYRKVQRKRKKNNQQRMNKRMVEKTRNLLRKHLILRINRTKLLGSSIRLSSVDTTKWLRSAHLEICAHLRMDTVSFVK